MDGDEQTRPHGTVAQISRLSGVPHETVRRYYGGGNVGIRSVELIREAETRNTGIRDEDHGLNRELAHAFMSVNSLAKRFEAAGELTPDEQAFIAHVKGARERIKRAIAVWEDVVSGGGLHFETAEDRRAYRPKQ